MGRIISSYIFPHPPIIIPEVGKGEEKAALHTINAVKKAALDIKNDNPTTIIITTPHGPVFQDYIYMSASERLSGDLGRFGNSELKFNFDNNLELVSKIIGYAKEEHIFSGDIDDSLAKKYKISKGLDHGAIVPLYFINKQFNDFKLVHISIAGLPFEDLYKFGMCISKAIQDSDEQVVFVASGDLSHKLSSDAPYGYSEHGREFDDYFVHSLKKLNIKELLKTDENFCESAGECGLRSFLIMFGALDGYDVNTDVYSYEGPFGVGYAVAKFSVAGKNPERNILEKVESENAIRMQEIRSNENPYISLARNALEAYVNEGIIIKVPDGLPVDMLHNKAGVFVSIKMQGQLRGCIGTTAPTRKNIAEEIIHNALSSGTQDPRFYPVEREELDKLVYSVDVLEEPEAIKSMDELDVKTYGVIVRAGSRSGLLLPNLEGVDTPEKQVSIALQKAGINPDENYAMERFQVIRHK